MSGGWGVGGGGCWYWLQGTGNDTGKRQGDVNASAPSAATMQIRNYQDLVVWKRAVEFVAEIYSVSARFPREERFGLTAQVRRASVSVSANIAEGSGRATSQ